MKNSFKIGRTRPAADSILPRWYILLICEGTVTEPDYFRSFGFREEQLSIYPLKVTKDPEKLFEKAERELKRNKKEKDPAALGRYDEIWVVFDKDNVPPVVFNKVIKQCSDDAGTKENPTIRAAWSNPCFELWFKLYFNNITMGATCDGEILEKYLKAKTGYDKTIYASIPRPDLFKHGGNESNACKWAKDLHDSYAGRADYANHNPCTTVYQLVERLKD